MRRSAGRSRAERQATLRRGKVMTAREARRMAREARREAEGNYEMTRLPLFGTRGWGAFRPEARSSGRTRR